MEMVAFASRSKRKPLCAAHEFDRSATRCTIRARHFAFQADARGSVLQDGITPGCQSSILFKPQFFVILESLIRGKEQETKSISGPAIVTQKALQSVFLAARLIVDGCDLARRAGRGFPQAAVIGLRPALHGIDQRDATRPEIQRHQRASIGWPQQGG